MEGGRHGGRAIARHQEAVIAIRLLIMRSIMNRRTANGERGAILAQVAISMLMLMGFAVFVLDYGVVLVSRGQAQNAADAGALAGAISRAFDDVTNPPPAGGVVELAATDVAQDNLVWNAAGSVAVSYACPPGVTGGGCVRVDVYRNGELASPTLPVFFAPVFGITSQGVRATATAQATCRERHRLPEAVGRRRQMARTRRAAMDAAIDFRPRESRDR